MNRLKHPAERSPARHRLALFRFIALVRPAEDPPVQKSIDYAAVHVLDPDQSSIECYLRGWLELAILACYTLAVLQGVFPRLNHSASVAGALALAWILFNVVFFFFAVPFSLAQRLGVMEPRQRLRGQTLGVELLLALAAVWAASVQGWIRWVGITWMSLLALNFLAFCAVTILKERVQKLEERLGGNEFVT